MVLFFALFSLKGNFLWGPIELEYFFTKKTYLNHRWDPNRDIHFESEWAWD